MDTKEMQDRKYDFVLWIYWAAGRPLVRHQRDYVAYLAEMQLREHGLTSGYKFTDGVIGPADTEFQNDAVILSASRLLDGPGRTNITHITEFGKVFVKHIASERFKVWLGDNYHYLENYVYRIAELERDKLLLEVRSVSVGTNLEALATA